MFRNHRDVQRTASCSTRGANAQIYKCDVCDAGWESETDTYIHKENHKQRIEQWLKEPGNHVCQICVTKQKSYKSLLEHIKTIHLLSSQNARCVEREIYICDICDQIFYNKHMLVIHIARRHWKPKETNQEDKVKIKINKIKEKRKRRQLKREGLKDETKCKLHQKEESKNKQNRKNTRTKVSKKSRNQQKDSMQSGVESRRITRLSARNKKCQENDENIKELKNALKEKGVSLTQINKRKSPEPHQSPEDYRIEIVIAPEPTNTQSVDAIENNTVMTEIEMLQDMREIENYINSINNVTLQTQQEVEDITLQTEKDIENVFLKTEQDIDNSSLLSNNAHESLPSTKQSEEKATQAKKKVKNKPLIINYLLKDQKAEFKNKLEKMKFPCPGCLKTIQFKSLWSHLRCHNASSVSICKICFVKCKDMNDLKKHLLTHPSYYHCEKCYLDFQNAEKFEKHLKVHDDLCSNLKLKTTADLETDELEITISRQVLENKTGWQFPKISMFTGLRLFGHLHVCILCRCICLNAIEEKKHVASHYVAIKTVKKLKKESKEVCTCGEVFSTSIFKKQHLLFNKDHSIKKEEIEEDIVESETANENLKSSLKVQYIEDLVPDLESVVKRIFI